MAVREGLVPESKAARARRREGYPALTPAFTWVALALRLFAFVVPFVMTFGFLVILQSGAGIWWSTHMWVGVSFMAGAVGLALAGLVRAEDLPQAS